MVEKKEEKRNDIKKYLLLKNEFSTKDRLLALKFLVKTRRFSRVRLRNRCAVTGRARGYMRTFGVSRITFQEFANKAVIPAIKKYNSD